jgi:hypothetical protein
MKFAHAVIRSVKMFTSPEFLQRIREEDESMLKHLDILKEINRCGYITTESQAGRKSSGISPVDKKHYEICERAYISGFMLESKASEFLKQMALHTDKNATYIPTCADDVHIPSNLDIALTTTKKDSKIQLTTHMSSVLPRSTWDLLRKLVHINKSEKIVFVFCWDPLWNRNASSRSGLFTDVLKILKSL